MAIFESRAAVKRLVVVWLTSLFLAQQLSIPLQSSAAGPTALNTRITGDIGFVDPSSPAGTSGFEQFYLRHIGNPLDPSTYIHPYYQRATPTINILSGPFSMRGTVDLFNQPTGSVGTLGFSDYKGLTQGGSPRPAPSTLNYYHTGYQGGAHVYIYKQATGWRIALTDGNINGGDMTQVQVDILSSDIPVVAGKQEINIDFSVNPFLNPNTCHNGGAGTAPIGSVGCMTLTISGFAGGPVTLIDSYGAIKAADYNWPYEVYSHNEFQYGAVPGWDDYLLSRIKYDVVVDSDGEAPTVSGVTATPNSPVVGNLFELSAQATAVGMGEVIKSVEYNVDGGPTWTPMALFGSTWKASITAPPTPGSFEYCIRATDGLSTTSASDETSDGSTNCVEVEIIPPQGTVSYTGTNTVPQGSRINLTASTDFTPACANLSRYQYQHSSDGITWVPFDNEGDIIQKPVITLAPGVYDVRVVYNGSASPDPNCGTDESLPVVLTVYAPGMNAYGGGFYTIQGSGKANFGFVVQKVAKTTSTFKGQVLWNFKENWRFKGTLNNFGEGLEDATPIGTASGTGILHKWNGSDWVTEATDVNVILKFTATTASGKKSSGNPGSFSINFSYLDPTLPVVNDLTNLKGGNIKYS